MRYVAVDKERTTEPGCDHVRTGALPILRQYRTVGEGDRWLVLDIQSR